MTIWKSFSISFVSILAFLGCIANIGVLKAIISNWHQGGIFVWLLFEVTLFNLVYLVQRSTLVNLENSAVDLTSTTTFWLNCGLLFLRFSSLVLSTTLAIERYLVLRRPRVHSLLQKHCVCGCILAICIPLLTGIPVIAYILASYHGIASSELASSRNVYAAKCTIIIQMSFVFASLVLVVYLAFRTKHGSNLVGVRVDATQDGTSHPKFTVLNKSIIRSTQSFVWFLITISLTSFAVCLLNGLALSSGDLMPVESVVYFRDIVITMAEWIDIIGSVAAPLSLLLSSKHFLHLAAPRRLVHCFNDSYRATNDNALPKSCPLIPREGYLRDTKLSSHCSKFRKEKDSEQSFRNRKFSKTTKVSSSFRDGETAFKSHQQYCLKVPDGSDRLGSPVSIASSVESEFSLQLRRYSSGSGFSIQNNVASCHMVVPEIEVDRTNSICEVDFDKNLPSDTSLFSELSIMLSPLKRRVSSINMDQGSPSVIQKSILVSSRCSLSLPKERQADAVSYPILPTTLCWQAEDSRTNEPCATPLGSTRCQKGRDAIKSLSPNNSDSDGLLGASIERHRICYQNEEIGEQHLPGFIPSPLHSSNSE